MGLLDRLLGSRPAPELPRARKGDVWDGPVAHCADPLLVPWPATYATTVNELGHCVVDPTVVVERDESAGVWVVA